MTSSRDSIDGDRVVVAASRFSRLVAAHVDSGRSLIATRVLGHLVRDPEGLRIGELAAREGITQPAMTAAVNRLAADGLIVRAPDENDGRAVVVRLTDRGRSEHADFLDALGAVVTPLFDALAPQDRDVLARATAILETLSVRLSTR